MTQRDRGLLIVSVSGMRTWAAGLGSSREVSTLMICRRRQLTLGFLGRFEDGGESCFGEEGQVAGGPEDLALLGSRRTEAALGLNRHGMYRSTSHSSWLLV
jgi:hypothetical protein